MSLSVARLLEAAWLDLSRSSTAPGTFRVGIDVVDIGVVDRQTGGELGQRFIENVFTNGEVDYCRGRVERFATRWAVKEAVSKAIGSGFRRGLRPSLIDVATDASGAISVCPIDGAGWPDDAHNWAWAVSASHDAGVAVAIALAVSSNHDERSSR